MCRNCWHAAARETGASPLGPDALECHAELLGPVEALSRAGAGCSMEDRWGDTGGREAGWLQAGAARLQQGEEQRWASAYKDVRPAEGSDWLSYG